MRLDKFLKVSRLVKRRPVAKQMADAGRIQVNDQVAKAGVNLKVNDILTIQYGSRVLTVRIVMLKENARKEEADKMYELVKEEKSQ